MEAVDDPHLSFFPPSAIFVLFRRPAFSSSWRHITKRVFNFQPVTLIQSAILSQRAAAHKRGWGWHWNVNSRVQQNAIPVCNTLHPEQTHLTPLLHHLKKKRNKEKKNRRRAALRSPTAAWPRLRCTKIDLITERLEKYIKYRKLSIAYQNGGELRGALLRLPKSNKSHWEQKILFFNNSLYLVSVLV